jgi:hypothetical protein
MPKVTFTGKDHGQSKFVGASDDVVIAHGTTWLNHYSDPCDCSCFHPISEGVERVAGARATRSPSSGFSRSYLARFDSILLTRANPPSRRVFGKNYRVRGHVSGDSPRELSVIPFTFGRGAFSHYRPFGASGTKVVGALRQPATSDLTKFNMELVGGWAFKHSSVFAFRSQTLNNSLLIARGNDEVCLGGLFYGLDCGEIDHSVRGDNATKSGARIAVEGPLVCVGEVVAGRSTTRVGVFNDRYSSLL